MAPFSSTRRACFTLTASVDCRALGFTGQCATAGLEAMIMYMSETMLCIARSQRSGIQTVYGLR